MFLFDSEPFRIPLVRSTLTLDEEEAVLRALRAGCAALGPETAALEAEFASLLGVSHAVAVSSGTAALHLALLALGVGPREDVIQPAINGPAAANMSIAVGAEPTFADIASPECPRIGVAQIEAAWTSRATTVVVAHTGGCGCDMRAISDYCRSQDLHLIEDAWHSLGLVVDGRYAGTWGDFGCFSLSPGGGWLGSAGGMLVTSRDDLAARARLLRSHGLTFPAATAGEGADGFDIAAGGYNYCLDEIHAAMARVRLGQIDRLTARRQDHARLYAARLAEARWLSIVDRCNIEHSTCHLLSVLVPAEQRAAVRRALRAKGIETGWHYPCLAELSAFRGLTVPRAVANALVYARREITLPMHPGLSGAEIKEVCDTLLACEPAVVA